MNRSKTVAIGTNKFSIPCASSGKVVGVLAKIAEKVKVRISQSDVEVVHRVPVPNNTAVKFILV